MRVLYICRIYIYIYSEQCLPSLIYSPYQVLSPYIAISINSFHCFCFRAPQTVPEWERKGKRRLAPPTENSPYYRKVMIYKELCE